MAPGVIRTVAAKRIAKRISWLVASTPVMAAVADCLNSPYGNLEITAIGPTVLCFVLGVATSARAVFSRRRIIDLGGLRRGEAIFRRCFLRFLVPDSLASFDLFSGCHPLHLPFGSLFIERLLHL